MSMIGNVGSWLLSDEVQDFALKTVAVTSLATICAYGGTFFFSAHNPQVAAVYMGVVALTGFVAYQVFELLKESTEKPNIKYLITAVQLLQIPVIFYTMPDPLGIVLSGAAKLEMINVTAHFVAIPVFFHLTIKAWNDPSLANIAATTGVMLSLVNGMRNFIRG